MARPLSEDKQFALLAAAAELVALQGVGAPTSQIARQAGVAEGTLFRYFATKDDLLNQLYLHLKSELCTALTAENLAAYSLKERAHAVWNLYIDWGLAHPLAAKALSQLHVSDKVLPETRAKAHAMFPDVSEIVGNVFAGLSQQQSTAFSEMLLGTLAETTLSFAASNPAQSQSYKAAGFAFLWRGLAHD
ncbi:TetR/AcrR family transcriptional regulator [Amantichitinum ursilacus]|uniref:Transcriptional regulator BetI n=1 Tax=Amantichitinum ursilacus TaxID=857265 RepID=A0A0N0XI35_9NEIS|nr:TetR/AcrR family transcriptional regulator [Amantichitinum ursilacus]KPC52521.1 transcriptional regulator BetI [Amantichitinum ursilacus]